MQPLPPALLELAQRLRQLRQRHWPDVRLTQAALAAALGGEAPLSVATVSSWESQTTPKLPPRHWMIVYARFFATPRSVEAEPFRLLPLDSLTPDKHRRAINSRPAARPP